MYGGSARLVACPLLDRPPISWRTSAIACSRGHGSCRPVPHRPCGGLAHGRARYFSVSLTVLVLGTVIELGFLGAVAGVAARRLSRGHFPGQSAWLACFLIYVACHMFGSALVTSRAVTSVALSAGSTSMRHEVLQRIARSGDRRYRETLLSALEKGSEPDVDEDIIGALTWLEDGAFWHSYSASPRGSRWGISFRAKVLCDISNKSPYLRQTPGVDFALLTESFASLSKMMFERMVVELPGRPELLNPISELRSTIPGWAVPGSISCPNCCTVRRLRSACAWECPSGVSGAIHRIPSTACTSSRMQPVRTLRRQISRSCCLTMNRQKNRDRHRSMPPGCASSSSTPRAWTERDALVSPVGR